MKSSTIESSNRRFLLALAGGLCASAMASFGQDLGTNLINYWDFQTNYNDQASTLFGAGSTVQDNGTPGTGTGLVTSGGPGGMLNYVHCNNAIVPSYIRVPATSDIYLAGKSLSVSVWIRITNFTKTWETVFAHGNDQSNYRLVRNGTNNWLEFVGGNGTTDKPVSGGAAYPVNDGNWHHIVCVSDAVNRNEQFWQDGVRIGYESVTGELRNNATWNSLLIGENAGGNRPWGGDIADMAMWTRVLTPTEIGNIYTKGSVNGKNLATVIAETPALDTDSDGLPDWWENLYALNPNVSTGDNGAAGDPDGDLRTNLQEYQNYNGQRATNPYLADTDTDGATDGQEFTAGTNPLVADTDGDGLSDGDEINTDLTNPLLKDTDGDGVTDVVELNSTNTNPLVANTGFDFGLLMNLPLNTDYHSSVNWVAPNAATATAVGPAPLTTGGGGKFGEALNLSNYGYLQVNGNENLFDFLNNQDMTVSMWFTVNAFNNNDAALIAKGNNSNPGNFRINRKGSTSTMSGNGGSGDTVAANAFTPGDGSWHHAVLVARQGVNVEFWVDGILAGTNVAPTLASNALQLWIGNNPQATGNKWNGKIDDVAVWRRPLSATEIGQIWNTGTGASIDSLILVDTDGDGMPNYWETQFGLNPNDATGDNGAAADLDGDGRTNLQEFQAHGPNPTIADADGDGLNDGQEFAAGSNPLMVDTDGDGLTDSQEVNTYLTNPALADTDGDGINDPVELVLGTNPAVANPGLAFGLMLNMPMDNDFNSGVNQAFYNNTLPVRANNVTASPVGTVTRTAGKFGNAATLTGAGYLSVNGIEDVFDFQGGAQSMTVSLWCKASALDTSNQCLIAKGDYSDTWRIARNGTNNWFGGNGGGGDITNTPHTAIDLNVWHHVVLISKYLTATELWVDGVQQETGTHFPNLRNSDKRLFIGENSGALNRRWKGQIDDVAIWRRALSPTEIASIFNSGTGVPIDTLIGADTDGDGMPDWWEKQFALDPNTNDAAGDADGDGLTNLQEFQTHATDPTVADTDGDGLNDLVESTAGSNPLMADTDGDGLTDGQEINTFGTNPTLKDSDGDGINDPVELALGTNPAVANPELAFGLVLNMPMDNDFNSGVNQAFYNNTLPVTANNVTASQVGTVTRTAGKFGNAATLTGAGYLSVNGIEDVFDFQGGAGQSMTVSLWCLASALDTSNQCLIAKGDYSDTWRITRNGSNNYFQANGGNNDLPVVGGGAGYPAINTNVWHHVVLVSKYRNTAELWVDGVLQQSGTVPNLRNSDKRLFIGENSGATNRRWKGQIDDLGIWRRALSPTEIASIYNSGTGVPIDTLIGADTDGDGMPDWWEKQFALDPNTNDAAGDPDGDGRTNLQEYQAHAPDPRVADTDGDGLDDGREFTAGTNPLLADTDGDGLTDSQEVNTYLTNPALADSDGDGMPDNVELALGYPPLVADLGFGFGMLAYFPMDADFNAVNSGVNGFTTTVQGSGVVSAPGKFGNSARLNGSGHLLVNGAENAFDFLPVLNGPQFWTVSMWFTQDTTPAGGNWDWKTLIAKGDGNTWRIAHAGGNPWLWYNVGNGLNVDMPAVVPATNPAVWHHIALIADNNHTECWYDGAKVMTGYAPKLENVATPLLIGNNPGNSNPYNNAPMARQWPGKIDDVAIWGRALSAAEIGQLWNGGTGRAVISPYDDWAYSKGLTGGPGSPTDPAKTADPDGDGVANVLEFFLDGNPLAGDVPHIQPSVVGGNFVLTYLRRDDAELLNIVPQSSTDLTNWATMVDGVNGVVISVDERGPDPDFITIRIPMGSEPRIFARLKYTP